MKNFKISLYEEIGGYAFIKAENKEEAKARAYQILDDEGVEGFNNKENCFDTTHRETTVLDVEEEK